MELFKNTVEYIAVSVSLIAIVINTYALLLIHHNENYEMKSTVSILKYFYTSKWQVLNWGIVALIMFLGNYIIQILYSIYLIVILVLYFKTKSKDRLPFNYRTFIYSIIFLLVYILLGTLILYWISLPEVMSSLALLILLVPIILIIINGLFYPFELLIKFLKNKRIEKEGLD